MSELDDILNSIPKQNIFSFGEIQAIHPSFDKTNIATYHLYLTYNANILTEDEKDKVREIINRLKYKQSEINKHNLEYMNRHLINNEPLPPLHMPEGQ